MNDIDPQALLERVQRLEELLASTKTQLRNTQAERDRLGAALKAAIASGAPQSDDRDTLVAMVNRAIAALRISEPREAVTIEADLRALLGRTSDVRGG